MQPGLSPQRFWGLRRPMLVTGQAGGNMAVVDDVDMDEDEEDEGEMDGEDEGGSEDDDGEDDDEGGGLGAQLLNTAIPHNLRLRILRFIGSRS